jgi:hypothetical protein
MVKYVEKLYEQIDELMEIAYRQISFKSIGTITTDEIKAMQSISKLISVAKQISIEQAETIEKINLINNKIDLLLEQNK